MHHSDLPWSPLLPDAEIVLQYLDNYAKEVLHLDDFRKQVLDVCEMNGENVPKLEVKLQNLDTNEAEQKAFDAVVVSSGRYNEPYVPAVPDLKL